MGLFSKDNVGNGYSEIFNENTHLTFKWVNITVIYADYKNLLIVEELQEN
jgi:hypothetical protein